MIIRKWLAVGIILLFVGIAIAPSINFQVVKASNDSDLVEVTSQACGIQEYGDTTVALTKQQCNDLKQYLVEFRARLNQTSTREEAVSIFKEAVVELDKYGLLPKGMSIEKAQRLVTIGEHAENIIQYMKKFKPSSTNAFCLFSGIFGNATDFNIFELIGVFLASDFFWFPPLWFLGFILVLIGYLKPLRFLNTLTSISDVYHFFSIGLQGIVKGPQYFDTVIGFTGLKIVLNIQDYISFYLGFALYIY
jgi:hypothetical protein